jgi:hypothetical protein
MYLIFFSVGINFFRLCMASRGHSNQFDIRLKFQVVKFSILKCKRIAIQYNRDQAYFLSLKAIEKTALSFSPPYLFVWISDE